MTRNNNEISFFRLNQFLTQMKLEPRKHEDFPIFVCKSTIAQCMATPNFREDTDLLNKYNSALQDLAPSEEFESAELLEISLYIQFYFY